MGKKRDKANEHIAILIDELVSERVSSLGTNCPHWRNSVRPCGQYNNDCAWCKEQWEEDMRERLTNKYIVN